jgi:hypothetical protein
MSEGEEKEKERKLAGITGKVPVAGCQEQALEQAIITKLLYTTYYVPHVVGINRVNYKYT